MNIIKTTDGTIINLDNVCFCSQSRSEGKYLVHFSFVGGEALELAFDTETAADHQVASYEYACKMAQYKRDKE